MKVFISGGAGFIGSHFAEHFLEHTEASVTVFDNFSSGTRWHLERHARNARLRVVEGDLQKLDDVAPAMASHDIVYHFASNPDIARAVTEPDIDFWQGTFLTHNVLEAMRGNGVPALVYASGSGVYGETGLTAVHEDWGPMAPVSTYGASKLAGESLICAYAHMFGIQAWSFRFANVVGPRQTHGVAYDFIRKLRANPQRLSILGDGTQSKSYIHVSDVVAAVQLVVLKPEAAYSCYNVATQDYIDVSTIAQLVIEELGLTHVEREYTGGDRGWKGDVPVLRFDVRRIHELGWRPVRSSLEAMRASIQAMVADSRI